MNIKQGSKMYYFNKYSWFLLIVYISVIYSMNFYSYAISWESLYLTCPLIISVIFWSERTTSLINKAAQTMTKDETFKRDLFLISFSFISGELFSIIPQFNNNDVRGWWPLALYFITAYGVLLAFIFSIFALLLNNHKKYTFVFFYLIIILIPFLSYLAYMNPFSLYAKSEFFYGYTSILIGIHLLYCLGQKALFFIQVKRS
jgi:hypothetical protein